MNEEDIIRIQPFSKIIGHIDKAISLKSRRAMSGESFRIIANGISYKLRACSDESKAITIENNVLLFPQHLPQFLGREGCFLLFKWIDGEILHGYTLKDCYLIGKMLGESHALNIINKDKNPDHFFESIIASFERVFPENFVSRVRRKYFELKSKLRIDITLELTDLHGNNFVRGRDGKLYFVDEEGLNFKIKGLAFTKPLIVEKWLATEDMKKEFWRGYNEHHSSDYFDQDYQEFLYFMGLVRKINIKIKNSENYTEWYEKLLERL